MHTKKTNNTNKLIQISYYSVLTKIQKLQNLKKKKKTFFCTGRYCPKLAGTAGIFSGMKQGGRVYRIASRYGIFRPYRPVRYGIDNLTVFTEVSNFNFITITFSFLVKTFSLTRWSFLSLSTLFFFAWLPTIIKLVNNRDREILQIEWFHNFGTTFDIYQNS